MGGGTFKYLDPWAVVFTALIHGALRSYSCIRKISNNGLFFWVTVYTYFVVKLFLHTAAEEPLSICSTRTVRRVGRGSAMLGILNRYHNAAFPTLERFTHIIRTNVVVTF
jgi:hypothetical protein